MIKLSKPFYSKLLIYATYCLILFTPIQVIAGDQIFNTSRKTNSDSGKQMKNIHWSPSKPESKPEETVESEDETAKDEENISPEKEIWGKYKELAAGTATKETIDSEEIDTTEETTKEATPDKKPSGLTAIIDDYKNAQKSKGKMNSRSFGSID